MSRKKQPKSPIDLYRPRAECFLLCDFARAENGKLYIVGGGWGDIVPQQLPLEYESYLAIKIVLPWESIAESVTVRVELLDKSGQILGDPVFEAHLMSERVDLTDSVEDAAEQGLLAATLLLATGVKLALSAPGRFILRLLANDEMIAATSFVATPPNAEGQPKSVEETITESPTPS